MRCPAFLKGLFQDAGTEAVVEQCGFCPDLGTVNQVFTLAFSHPVFMYFSN